MKTVCLALAIALVFITALAVAQNVKIKPVESHPGELCANDRATVFEAPAGVCLRYDPAHNLTAGDDVRLSDIPVVLLNHMYGDRLGD